MGSWTFVVTFVAFMVAWAVINTFVLRSRAFDAYPYIALNLLLSTMAGLQAAALLIAAKRSDSVSAEVALHTEQNTDSLVKLLERNTELTTEVHQLANVLERTIGQVLRTIAAADPACANLIPVEWGEDIHSASSKETTAP